MAKRDYYEILGVDRGADESTIKSAYRKKAMQFHPDRNPGDKSAEENFKEATEAYEVLKDPNKRNMYDQFGHAGVGQASGFAGASGFGFDHFDLGDALRAFMRDFGGGGSIFDDFFGGSTRSAGHSNRGEDLRIRLKLTLEEIATGTEHTIKVQRPGRCEACDGTGVAAGSMRKTCPQCKGAGQVRTLTRTFLGTVQQVSTCPACRGEGEIISDPCRACNGEGRRQVSTTVTVKVPPGVSSGNYMTIDGKGNAGMRGGRDGDLVVVFEEEEHKQFTRHGDDIIYQLPIAFTTAALGGEVEVPTLYGKATLKIPSGTQSGKLLKLRARGIPHLHRTGKGDQLVQVTVWVPTRLSPDDQRLLRTLSDSESFRPPSTDRSFFQKLRETLGV